MRHPTAHAQFSTTQIAGASATAAVLFEAITFARSARQAASIAIEQISWQLTEVTGAGADSARDLIIVLGKSGQLLNEAVYL
eukprot:15460335-Alexandrium_andersonii.AAC.1